MLFLGKIVFGDEIVNNYSFVNPLKVSLETNNFSCSTKMYKVKCRVKDTSVKSTLSSNYRQSSISKVFYKVKVGV